MCRLRLSDWLLLTPDAVRSGKAPTTASPELSVRRHHVFIKTAYHIFSLSLSPPPLPAPDTSGRCTCSSSLLPALRLQAGERGLHHHLWGRLGEWAESERVRERGGREAASCSPGTLSPRSRTGRGCQGKRDSRATSVIKWES